MPTKTKMRKRKKSKPIGRYDPTRTGMLRRKFTSAIRRKFLDLKLELVKLIAKEDAFGLKQAFTINPFVSEEQRKACYAANDPNWDCEKWEEKTANAFCATGEGGGVDPTCGKDEMTTTTDTDTRYTVDFKVGDTKYEFIAAKGKTGWSVEFTAGGADTELTGEAGHKATAVMRTVGRALDKFISEKQPEEFHFSAYEDNKSRVSLYTRVSKFIGARHGYNVSIEEDFGDVNFTFTKKPTANQATCDYDAGFDAYFSPIRRSTENVRWALADTDVQVKKFKQWLKQQVSGSITGTSMEDLWKRFMLESFKKGAGRSVDDAPAQGPGFDRETFLRTSFGKQTAPEKVQIIASRSFSNLEGVTDAMSARMVQVLTKGFTAGDSPRTIAKELAKEVDISLARALAIARTEIIAAHAQGQLNTMRSLGLQKVGVMVEWAATEDDRVCDLCASMDGQVYTLEEAEGKIPAHPNCRCAFIPAEVGEAPTENVLHKFERLWNIFCATGPGGGVDPTCGKGEGGSKELPNPDTVKVVKELSGSTNPKLVEDEDGKQWVMKKGNKAFVKSEAEADAAYRALGVATPNSGLKDGVKFSEYIEGGQTLAQWKEGKSPAQIEAMHKEISKGFVADALLANRDSIGLANDNILIKDGKPYRIDNGGSLAYRAQGALKTDFGEKVGELETLRDKSINATAAEVFKSLTKEDINNQIKDVLSKKDAVLATITDQKVRDTLSKRFDDLKSRLDEKPAAAMKAGAKPQVPTSLTKGESKKIDLVNPDGIKDGKLNIPSKLAPDKIAELEKLNPGVELVKVKTAGMLKELAQSTKAGASVPKEHKSVTTEATGIKTADGAHPAKYAKIDEPDKPLSSGYKHFQPQDFKPLNDPTPSGYTFDDNLHNAEELTAHFKAVKLSKEELISVKMYTNTAYLSINEAMRECPPDFDCVKGGLKMHMDNILSAIEKAPEHKHTVVVARGLNLTDAVEKQFMPWLADKYKAGEPVQFPSITSTSFRSKGAIGHGVQFHIRTRHGLYVDSVSQNPGEKELLISPNAKFKITAMNYKGGQHRVYMEEV